MAIAFVVSSLLFASRASAQCVEALPNVTCTGADADGYDAGVENNIAVDVQGGATVDGGANTEAIRLNDDSSLANAGGITLGTADGVAVQMGENATITNDLTIEASGTDGRAIAVGDGADITNNATGVITGGADGASDTAVAVDFTGTDAAATNVLRNTGGTITGGADGAVDGSAGRDEILLQAGSTTTGDINTNGGNDLVRLIGAGASLTGDVNLGAGDDRMDINGAVTAYAGDVDGGDGDNTFVVTGSGAEFQGNYTGGVDTDEVFFFQNTTVDSNNVFDLGGGADLLSIEGGGTSSFDFDLLAGAGDDMLDLEDDVTAAGNVELGAGSDTVVINGDAIVSGDGGSIWTGNIDVGVVDDLAGDVNTVTIGINATLTGDVSGGAGDDSIILLDAATLTGNLDLGAGSDRLTIDGTGTNFTGNFTGGEIDFNQAGALAGETRDLTLGSGSMVTGGVVGGAGNDSLTLDLGANITGTVDLAEGGDTVVVEDGASFGDTVDLGAGNDQFQINDGATVTGTTINLGGGFDSVDLLGDADVAEMSGSTFTGNIDVGVAADVAGEINSIAIGINATLAGDLLGGAGDDNVTLSEAATLTGQLSLGDGDNEVIVDRDAEIQGVITLGSGNDTFTVLQDANFVPSGGTLSTGDGNDTVVLSLPTESGVNTGAILTGTVDLGGAVSDDADVDFNTLRLQRETTLDGSVLGGAQGDFIDARGDSVITGAVDLLGGDDLVSLRPTATIQGELDLGDGADFLAAGEGAQLDSDVRMGDGADEILISNLAVLGGNIDMGPGDDLVVMRPSTMVPADLTLGDGVDTLQLAAEDPADTTTNPIFEVDVFEIQDALGADRFEALIVGPEDDGNPPSVWQLSTSGRAQFDSGTTFRNGAAVFDGAFRLEGDTVQESNTVLVFDLGDALVNGQLDIVGGLTINASDLGDPEDPNDDLLTRAEVTIAGDLESGAYDLIVTTTGIDRLYEDSEFATPDLLTYTFSRALSGDGNRLVLNVVRNGYTSFGRNSSEANVGAYLDTGRSAAGGVGPFAALTNELDDLNESSLQKALSQLNGEAYDAHTSSVVSWGRIQQRILRNRPMRCERFTYSPRPEIISVDPCAQQGIIPWARAIGDFSKHKGNDDRGYDGLGGGGVIGLDHRVSERVWWSASAGFGQIEIDGDNDADGDFQSIDLGAAVGAVFGAIQVRGAVTYSHGFHEIVRQVEFRWATLNGKFDSDRVGLGVEARYRARVGPIGLEPGLRGSYMHVTEESVDEDGDDVIALDVDARETDLYSVAAGLSIRTSILKYAYAGDWLEWADGVWTPELSAHWRQDFGDVDRDLPAEMQGAPAGTGDFDSEARDSNGGVEVRGGVTFQPLESAVAVGIHYDGYFGDDVTNHSANASVRIPF